MNLFYFCLAFFGRVCGILLVYFNIWFAGIFFSFKEKRGKGCVGRKVGMILGEVGGEEKIKIFYENT